MLSDSQKKIDELMKENNWDYWSPHEILVQMTEELGEIGKEINAEFGPKPKKDSDDGSSVDAEIGDLLFAIMCLSNSLEIDLDKSLEKTAKKFFTRDKYRF